MERTYALEEIQAIVYPILRSHGVSRAYLFGSYARGEATGKSDIDLRIDAGKIKGMFALGALYHDLTEVLEKPVHLVTTESLEHSANVTSLRSNIEEDERLIYEETEQPVACSRLYRK